MKKWGIWLILVAVLSSRNAVGQTTGPYELDKVATATGIGSPAIGPLTPSQQNELAFLIVGADYGDYSNCNPQSSYLSGMSAPWVWAGTGRDEFSIFAANPNGPFYIGPPTYSSGPGAPPDYPFWMLTSSPVSGSGTNVQQGCYTTAWSAVLALFKYVGTQLPGSPVARYVAAGYGGPGGSGTSTVSGWGLGYAPSSPMFLIGYMWTQGAGPDGGENCNEGPYITPAVSLSDPVGNKYQVIADVKASHVINFGGCDQATGNRLIMFMVPDFKGANGANTLTIAAAGGDPSIANAVYIAAVVYQKAPMPSLVDPIGDTPDTSLLNGASVTSDAHLLATGGRLVQGVGADGVTQVVLRIPTTNVGDQVSLTLMNDQSSQSTSPDDDGGLGQIGATVFTQSQLNMASQDTVGQGPYAFAIYRAPVDFARQSGSDNQSAQRSVSVQVHNLTQGTTSTLPIAILRPPLVLIHGIWADWSVWNNFSPLVTGPGTVNPLFSIGRVSYDDLIGPQIGLTDPVYPAQLRFNMRANSMGYGYNAPNVLAQMQQWIKNVKNGQNPAGIQMAAVQADVVGHSMGGLIARTLVLQPGFLSNNTFGQGTIHKMITVDTPHLGSPLAIQLLSAQENGGCVQKLFASYGGLFAINSAVSSDNSSSSGAVADLQGDDTTGQLSSALASLNASAPHPIPISFLTGIYQNFASLDSSNNAAVIRTYCSGDPMAQMMTSASYPTIFHNNPNDAIVSEASQLNGLIPSPSSQFFGEMHSPGIKSLGFAPPSVMDGGAVPTQVISLLNTSWKNSVYYNMVKP